MTLEQAVAVVADPYVDPALLAEVAYRFPHLRGAVAVHPQAYAGLRQWIADAGERAPGTPPTPRTVSAAAPQSAGPSRAGAASTGLLGAVVTGLVSVVAVVVLVSAAFAATPLFGGVKGGGTATTQAAGPLTVVGTAPTASDGALASGVKLAWTKPTAQLLTGDEADGVDSVTMVGGVAVAHVVGEDRGYLVGIDPATGDVRWQSPLNQIGGCAPQAIDDSVYCFNFESIEPTLQVWRISARDGSVTNTFTLNASDGSDGMTLDQLDAFDGAVVAVEMTTGADGQPTGTVVRLPADLSTVTWSANLGDIRVGDGYLPSIAREQSGVLVISDDALDVALDFATGSVIETDSRGTSDVGARGDVVVSTTDAPPAPGHTVVQNPSATPVDFSSSVEAPPLPVYYTAQSDGTVTVSGYQTDGTTPAWSSPVSTVGSSSEQQVFGAYAPGDLVLVDTAGHVTSVDPSTGAVRWSNSYAAPMRDDDLAGYAAPEPFLVGNMLIVADDDKWVPGDGYGDAGGILAVFNAQTGAAEWTETGMIPVGGNQTAAPLLVGTPNGIGALVGTNATTVAAPTASGLPSCPSGMTPVSCSTYPGGHVLLCGGHDTYTVDYEQQGESVACSALDFLAGGYRLTCAGRQTVLVTAGGAVVQVSGRSGTWTQPAADAWSAASPGDTTATSTGFGPAPAKVPASCPAGSVELSLSMWHGGWLLVCGTDALHATSFAYRVGGRTITGAGMQYQDGRYCGTDANGATVCASSTPAVVTVTPKGGSASQYSVDANTFAATGAGGAGKGTGAYQVKAPNDTANDEVRYLVQILQKSEAGRAQAQSLVNDIANCSVSTTDVSTAASLVDNRKQLLSALASTPSGTRLVAELTTALQSSLQADQLYQQAASDMVQGDCDAGTADMASDTPDFEDSIGAQKTTFVNDWNSTIAGKFDNAPTFDESKI